MKQSYNESGIQYAIRQYNQSEGFNLPSDWEDHIIGGDMEGTCVFCKNHNAQQIILPTVASMHNSAPMPIPICYTCYDEVTKDATPAWFNSQDYLSAGGVGSWSGIVSDFILPFVESGIYPDKNDNDKSFELCDFCGNECAHVYGHFSSFANIDDATHFNHLIPVKKNVNLIEPAVVACIRCESAIQYLTNRVRTTASYQEIVMANCAVCNCSHPLKIEEYEARQEIAMKVPLNSYVCPLCAGEYWENQQRWVTVKCDTCKNEQIFDRLEKRWYRGDYQCSCLPQKKKDVPLQTFTFIYDVKGKHRHIAINIVEIECGGVKKLLFTVIDNDVQGDHKNVLPLGSTYEKCTQTVEGNCGCLAVSRKQDTDLYILDLHLQIFSYLLKHDSS